MTSARVAIWWAVNLRPINERNLDAYSRLALPAILRRFPEWEPFATVESRSDGAGDVVEFNVPCPSPAAVHGLWVSTDNEELSVGFHMHHRHFTDYDDERTHLRQIDAGISYASDILAERIGVISWYRAGQFVGSTSVHLPCEGSLHQRPPTLIPLDTEPGDVARATLRSWLGRFDRDE